MEASYQNQEVGVFLTPEKDPTTESAPTNDAYLTVYASEGPAFRCLPLRNGLS